MVTIRMKTTSAGPGGMRHPGQVVQVSEAEADSLVNGGFAEPLGLFMNGPVPELTTMETPERAVMSRGKGKQR